MPKTTTTPHQTVQTMGAATIMSVAVVTKVAPNRATSIHDCASLDQVALHNMVWPINMATPARADGQITCKNGVVVMGSAPAGSVTVVTA